MMSVDRRSGVWKTVESMVGPDRWAHIRGVVDTARELSVRFGVDESAAELAALLHDAAREWPVERLARYAARGRDGPGPLEQCLPELLHGYAAAAWAEIELGITDPQVLAAVRYHTTGRPNPTRLEMVLMVADYSEPTRSFPEAEPIRKEAQQSLEAAYLLSLDTRLRHLIDRGLPIHPRTVEARNWLLLRRADGFRG
ncbi:MAG: bis(5'-nucleosyl)-tetraphosphatase (symmetrical) YqeK [Bacillota bacterium]